MTKHYVYLIESRDSKYPDMLIWVDSETDARISATARLPNVLSHAVNTSMYMKSAIPQMDHFYLDPSNAKCHKLEKDVHYKVHPIHDNQIIIEFRGNKYILSSGYATLITEYFEKVS